MASTLPAKIKAVNRANEYGVKLYQELEPIFRPLVGQSILNKNGTLAKRFAKLLPELPCTTDLHVYRGDSNYSLAWCVKTCEMNGDGYGCVYHEITVYIGNIRGDVLTEICSPFTARTDYTAEEVHANREKYESAKKLADDARSKLYPFGEYDR